MSIAEEDGRKLTPAGSIGSGPNFAAVQFATLATGLTLDQTDFSIIA